jgi:hypothetical protein
MQLHKSKFQQNPKVDGKDGVLICTSSI